MSFPTKVPAVQIYAGDTYIQDYVFKDSTGAPINLDGWSNWKAEYRTSAGSPNSVDFDVDITGIALGEITVTMPADVTATLRHNGVWDLQATQGTTVKTFLASDVIVECDVTRV